MPHYNYKCEKCDHTWEVYQGIKENPLTKCANPKCKGKAYRVIHGGAGFIFKGSGFYITDYRSKDYKKAAEKEKNASSSSNTAKSDSSKTPVKSESAPKNETKVKTKKD